MRYCRRVEIIIRSNTSYGDTNIYPNIDIRSSRTPKRNAMTIHYTNRIGTGYEGYVSYDLLNVSGGVNKIGQYTDWNLIVGDIL